MTEQEPITVVSTSRSDASRKAFDQQAALAQSAFDQKMISVGNLAAGIAHEINTPMQYISDNICFLQEACQDLRNLLIKYQGLTVRLRSGEGTEESLGEIEKFIEQIDIDYLMQEIPNATVQARAGIQRVTNIVAAMKTFSHPGSSQRTEVNINKALENTLALTINEWKYVAQIKTNYEQNLPSVHGFSSELDQVFLNLLMNAVQAMKSKHKETGEKGLLKVETRLAQAQVEVKISDSGIGVPAELQQDIFKPFVTTKEPGRGTGQGLAIAYSIVKEKHNGEIDFESEPGKGTTFKITLPLNSTRNSQYDEQASTPVCG